MWESRYHPVSLHAKIACLDVSLRLAQQAEIYDASLRSTRQYNAFKNKCGLYKAQEVNGSGSI